MARRGRRRRSRTVTRTVERVRSRGRRGARSFMNNRKLMDGIKGLAAGLAIAVPASFLAQRLNAPIIFEAGERGGAIAASALGGTWGQVAFQAADAAIERVLPQLGTGSGGGIGRLSQVYA